MLMEDNEFIRDNKNLFIAWFHQIILLYKHFVYILFSTLNICNDVGLVRLLII